MSQENSKSNINLWAIVLAGGPNSRRSATGKQIPTVYQPIGLEPVINCSVSTCKKLITPVTGRVIILTRKNHPKLNKVNLQNWAKGWKETHFLEDKDIDIWYEDEAVATSNLKVKGNKIFGACIALKAFIELLDKVKWVEKHSEFQPPTHVLIIAGDNYFDNDLKGIKDWMEKNPEVGVVATREIDESADAAGRFGVMKIDAHQMIEVYTEKPENPKYKTIAPAIYCLPIIQLRLIEEHVTQCLQCNTPDKLGPPGYFIEHLVRSKKKLHAEELPGLWVNVGTETGYLSSIIQLTTNLLRQPKSAKELFAMGDAMFLSDKSYFLCNKVRVDSKEKSINLDFFGDDSVAVLSSNNASDNVLTVAQVREDNLANDIFWEAIIKGEDYNEDKLPSPILISGGVFLLNQPDIEDFDSDKAQVPLLIRDITANVDPLRLTMPAGRMDKLNLSDVCISELAEEMIFFGGETGHQILVINPKDYGPKVEKIIRSRLSNGNFVVPGLDPAQFKEKSLLVNSPARILRPPNGGWKVQIRYKADNNSDWIITQKPFDEFALIPDKPAATLEFRLTVASNLTGEIGHPSTFDKNSLKLGTLRGVIDGDGYERMVLFVSYDDLKKYILTLEEKGGAVLKTSDPHDDALPIIAITDGKSGRFRKIPDNYRLSVAALTTTLSKLVV